jgi:hypothetical protein
LIGVFLFKTSVSVPIGREFSDVLDFAYLFEDVWALFCKMMHPLVVGSVFPAQISVMNYDL